MYSGGRFFLTSSPPESKRGLDVRSDTLLNTESLQGGGELTCIPLSGVEENVGHKVSNHFSSSSTVEGGLNFIPPSKLEESVRYKVQTNHFSSSPVGGGELNCIPLLRVGKSVRCGVLAHCTSCSTLEVKLQHIPLSRVEEEVKNMCLQREKKKGGGESLNLSTQPYSELYKEIVDVMICKDFDTGNFKGGGMVKWCACNWDVVLILKVWILYINTFPIWRIHSSYCGDGKKAGEVLIKYM